MSGLSEHWRNDRKGIIGIGIVTAMVAISATGLPTSWPAVVLFSTALLGLIIGTVKLYRNNR